MADDRLRPLLFDALASLLEPIVLLLLKGGVSWKEFAAIAKTAFVRVATREFGIRGRPTNLARVAILTGMDRREVRKLRDAVASKTDAPKGFMGKPTQVLEAWYRDPDFRDEKGKPLELPLLGESRSFEALVRRYAPGLPVVAMAKELRAAGAIESAKRTRVRPVTRTYIPRALSENQIRLWGSALRDMGTTLESNVTHASTGESRFERRALNLSVDPRSLPEFRAFLESEGQAFLERVDEWLNKHQVNAESEAIGIRLGVGVYHIQDHESGQRRTK
jgi:hypothetical protein